MNTQTPNEEYMTSWNEAAPTGVSGPQALQPAPAAPAATAPAIVAPVTPAASQVPANGDFHADYQTSWNGDPQHGPGYNPGADATAYQQAWANENNGIYTDPGAAAPVVVSQAPAVVAPVATPAAGAAALGDPNLWLHDSGPGNGSNGDGGGPGSGGDAAGEGGGVGGSGASAGDGTSGDGGTGGGDGSGAGGDSASA
jgi:hypothetical protein